ncbi:MAG: hypothetical protein D9V47_12400 [Clostridia bacterium]|nr:MAG: hypothetical protein D9V47_12400 [Clostridia bacterium]
MSDLFTYASLGTLTGAVTATVLVVEFLKELGPLKRLPTRWLALAVAEGIVVVTSLATGNFAAANLPLYFLNGLLVAASAIGGWQVIHDNLVGSASGKKGDR